MFEPAELVVKRVMAEYDRNPKGWSVLADRNGNVLIMSPNAAYRLRLIPLNPNEYTGVGVKVKALKEPQKAFEGLPPYGFRPLSRRHVKKLFGYLQSSGSVPRSLMRELLRKEPVSTLQLKNLNPRAVLNGPVTFTSDLNRIVHGQRELERKLEVEAYKLFKRKYPSRAAFYGW